MACPQDFGGVAPVHTHKKDRSVDREMPHVAKCAAQEILVFSAGHFPGCHGEFAMSDVAGAPGMSTDPDIGRGVAKYHCCAVIRENRFISGALKCVPTAQTMLAQLPEVTSS